jgi:predicted HicB family RNase H-like nuclease
MLIYKGYIGHVIFDDEAEIFHGEVINIRDIVTFQGDTVKQIKKEFKNSIDIYLEFCRENNEEPDKPFSGKFNIRVSPELHKDAVIAAKKSGCSLNSWVVHSIEKCLYPGR